MNRLVQTLRDGWRIVGFDPHRGLAARAYAADFEPQGAVPATVPMTVRNALLQAGAIPDPYVLQQSNETKWVEEKEWWYLHDFQAPELADGERAILRFEGITYRAEIWVNGIQVGRLEGMFRVGEFDITELLKPGANRLSLRVRCQEDAHLDDRGHPLSGKIRTQGAVAQSMYRWNWCPHLVAIGIWQPVRLLVRGATWLDRVRVHTGAVDAPAEGPPPATANAELLLEWRLRHQGETPVDVQLDWRIGALASGGDTVRLKPGEQTIRRRISVMSAPLWWCNGLGEPALQCLETRLSTNGEQVEMRQDRFGIRTAVYVPNDDQDEVRALSGHSTRPWSMIGELYPWTLLLNNRRVFMKGSNWVLLDSLLRLDEARYEVQLSLFQQAGFNFLRVWGGSLAETPEFYSLCDRLGILCWQEFWLACGNYPAMDDDVFMRSVTDTVDRLINHPSLVHYSGGNEYEPDNAENKPLVDNIARAVARLDPGREFRRGSPYKGDRHGGLVPTPFMTRNKYLDILPGESRIVLMRSETATGRSTPLLGSLEKMIPADRRWPLDMPLWRHHFAVPAEFHNFANEYAALDDFHAALHANWLSHSVLVRNNLEYCRSRMYRCSGNLNWQFNVPWPCMHRELVDHWGIPKPSYYAYRNSARELAMTVDLERYVWSPGEELEAGVHLVNDGLARRGLQAEVRLLTTDLDLLHRWQECVEAPENGARHLASLGWRIPAHLASRTILIQAVLREGDRCVHENLYWVAVSNHVHQGGVLLDGVWERADGTPLRLPGNDLTLADDGFESVIFGQQADADLERLSGADAAPGAAEGQVSYRRTFSLADELREQPLEFFTVGFEASDEVLINGQVIGAHRLKRATLKLADMAFIPYGQEASTPAIDPDSEYPFFSDPIIYPKLDCRFYDIPPEAWGDGEQVIELRLRTRCQKSVPHALWIRPRTPNREEVRRTLKRGVFFGDLRRLPPARVEVEIAQGALIVRNVGDSLAMQVILEVSDGARPIVMEDNAFHLWPGDCRRLRSMGSRDLPANVSWRLYGWNVGEQRS